MVERTPPRIQTNWTYHDLADLPADVIRYELWEGELIILPAPTIKHQELVGRMFGLFVLHDPQRKLGRYFVAPADVVLAEGTTLQPDVFSIAKAREHIIQDQQVMGAPDLVVEVLSPGSEDADKNRKRRYYTAAGVREYWLLDSDARTLTIYDLDANTHTVCEVGAVAHSTLPELSGLTVDISALFAGL